MSHGYSHVALTSNVTTAEAAWELIAGTKGAMLKRLLIQLTATTATALGLGRPTAKGITPTTPVLFQPHKVGDTAAVASTALAWGTKPTAPPSDIYLRRCHFPAVIGSSIEWRWENGLFIPASASLVLFNLA